MNGLMLWNTGALTTAASTPTALAISGDYATSEHNRREECGLLIQAGNTDIRPIFQINLAAAMSADAVASGCAATTKGAFFEAPAAFP